MTRDAYKVISMLPDAPPVTWKLSGEENDTGALKGRGIVGNRREGRTENVGPVGVGMGFGVPRKPD